MIMGTYILLHLMIYALSFVNLEAGKNPHCMSLERATLLEIKASFRDPFDELANWNSTSNCCSWNGVRCDDKNGHVVGLELAKTYLDGTLSPAIGKLMYVEILNMSSCQILGSIPDSLAALSKLRILDLSYNRMSSIPMSLGSLFELRVLNLSHNSMEGQVPTSLGFLSNLNVLDLSYNAIHGPFPSSMGFLHSLQFLELSHNGIEGAIPHSLGNLLELRILNLEFNYGLYGAIPDTLGNLKKLKELNLSSCALTGTIPETFKSLRALKKLDLSTNMQLRGSIDWLANLYNIEVVLLEETSISGAIPLSLGQLSKLRHLQLSKTQISGILPSSIGDLFSLQNLEIKSTGLSGSLPSSLGKLFNLQYLDLYNNHLSGAIPESLGSLHKLAVLELSFNRGLNGSIPKSFGQLSSLQYLSITGTSISGKIPDSLGLLSNLEILRLSDNQLSGQIPASFGLLSRLTELQLSYNQLSGPISQRFTENLRNLFNVSLQYNKITALPPNMRHLANLSTLQLDNNNFGFQAIAGLATLPNLVSLGLSKCGLTGNIPNIFPSSLQYLIMTENEITGLGTSLRSLQNLRHLYLSFNKLEGQIKDGDLPFSLERIEMISNKITGLPHHMENFTQLAELYLDKNELSFKKIQGLANAPALGKLSLSHCKIKSPIPKWFATIQIQSLPLKIFGASTMDLSFNNISGEIPAEFEKNTHLLQLELQNNQLTGQIPLGLANKQWWIFNVSNNRLRGEIPPGASFMSLDVSNFEGNPGLCGARLPPCQQ